MTIEVKISSDRTLDIKNRRFGGIQGDIGSVNLDFDISDIEEQGQIWRVEFKGCAGTFESTIPLTPNENHIVVTIPTSITDVGGTAQVYLIEEIISDNEVVKRVCSYPLRLYFYNKPNKKVDGSVQEYERNITDMYLSVSNKAIEMEKSKEQAVKACELAVESIDNKEYRLSAGDEFTSEVLKFSRYPTEQRTLVTLNKDMLVTQSEYENEIKPLIDEKCTESQALWNVYNQINYSQGKNNPIQVEESGDKSFRIILNTDTELSEESSNPVANSTITSKLNEKVDVSEYESFVNKKYEVIETVTTEEEISVFSRSQEPDGTAYKFDRMKVLLEIATADSTSSILVRMQKATNSSWVYWYQNASGISTSKKYLSCEGYKNCGIWDNETLYGGGEYLVPNKVGQVPAFWGKFSEEAVPQICYLYIAGKLPIGTKITILGVRA